MNEEKVIVAAALPPPSAPCLSAVVPPKRRKGRPPKNLDLMPTGENCAAALPPKPRKRKYKKVDMAWPAVDNGFVGQQVHGVLDGSFDAGYLLTVRVGNTQTILRGAVFEPSLSVPITQANDIAPHVKFISRSAQVAPPLPCPEEYSISPALPSSAGPSLKLGNTSSACVPSEVICNEMAPSRMEEGMPSKALSFESSLMPAMPTMTEYYRDATLFSVKDHGTEEKIDLQAEQQSRQHVTFEAHVS